MVRLRLWAFAALAFVLVLVTGALRVHASVPAAAAPIELSLPPLPSEYTTRSDRGFEIAYPESVSERVEPIVQDLVNQRERLARTFGQDVLSTATIRLVRHPEDMARLGPIGAPPPGYAVGVTYPRLRVILVALTVPRTYQATEVEEVLTHELSHLALHDALGGRHAPRWFDDGLAIHLSGEHRLARNQTLWMGAVSSRLIPVAELDRSFVTGANVDLAYAQAGDLVRYMLRDQDRARFVALIAQMRAGADLDRALVESYRTDLRKLEHEWKTSLEQRFSVLPAALGGAVWGGILLLLVLGYRRKRREARARLRAWAAEEEAQDRLRALLVPEAESARDGRTPLRPTYALPRVEHSGSWHTLH